MVGPYPTNIRKLLLVIGMTEELTFEKFNQLVDESHDEGCGMCFSFHHYAHLDQAARKVAYLGVAGKEEERIGALADELDRRAKDPIDDNIFFLIQESGLLSAKNPTLQERIMIQVLHRADEMLEKKMQHAWVAVRAYAWMDKYDPVLLVCFLDSTEDHIVWQVILGNLGWGHSSQREKFCS